MAGLKLYDLKDSGDIENDADVVSAYVIHPTEMLIRQRVKMPVGVIPV